MLLLSVLILSACGTAKKGVSSYQSPRERYMKGLEASGLAGTPMGRRWIQSAEQSYKEPIKIKLPYSEKGYFSDTHPDAVSFSFIADQNENISIEISTNPEAGFHLFTELWYMGADSRSTLLRFADTPGVIRYTTRSTGTYILRLQPELLQSGAYTCSIIAGSTLLFPVSRESKWKIGSVWGDGRDGGTRKHEGIDIMAPRYTPAVASADGVVTRTGENKLGGKVVWLRLYDSPYTLYYAHLDSQLVTPGTVVRTGQPIGLIGNTGNARGGSPHLHFGIYVENNKAIDPLPFVKNGGPAKPIIADTSLLSQNARTIAATYLYSTPTTADSIFWIGKETLLHISAATDSWYRVRLPDHKTGYVPAKDVTDINTTIAVLPLSGIQVLYDAPSANAIPVKDIPAETSVPVYAGYNNYWYIKDDNVAGWIKSLN